MDVTHAAMTHQTPSSERWQARRVPAALLRAFILLAPIACSLVFVHVFSRLLPVPTDSLVLYLTWWVGISGAATVGLVLVDRLVRRLLPLAALLKLSLVFPDEAPSRFRTALQAGGVESLEQRLREARSADVDETPAEAAQRLLRLVAALDVHDRLTRGHADRVRAYARLIAEEMGLDRRETDLLNWSALLHDIGKLEIPSEILTNPGRPTDEEWRVLKGHPERGEELVEPLREWLGEWSGAVGQHHERWDGRGYPHGRAGSEISLAARIVAVADVFDVITSVRSYKDASSTTDARKELARSAGTHLDPRVVRAFLSVSLGRLRFVMGPLSWLSHAPILGRIPLTPAVSSLAGTLAVVATAVSVGIVAPPGPRLPPLGTDVAQAATSSTLADLERWVNEDEAITVRLPAVTGAPGLAALRLMGARVAGRATVTRSGAILYVPPTNYHGVAVFHYRACWNSGRCRTGVLRVSVRPVNDAPTAVDDVAYGLKNAPVLVRVLRNDFDPDRDRLTVSAVGRETDGRADVVGQQVRWLPPRGFIGDAFFGYRITDGHGGRARARVRVRVRVRAGNTAPAAPSKPASPPATAEPPPTSGGGEAADPANRPPHAADDDVTVLEGGTAIVDVLGNDSDPDGDGLTLISVGSPSLGTVAIAGVDVRFTAPNMGGSTEFAYTIGDRKGATDRGRVHVLVVAVNSAPSFIAGPDQVVAEGSGPAVVPSWARDISAGPADEVDQRVSFTVETDRPGLFSSRPEVGPEGTLRFTPA
ncbi:MAG: HD domain-containing phosphohydrolase, partial [Actinomycetota bacterium]